MLVDCYLAGGVELPCFAFDPVAFFYRMRVVEVYVKIDSGIFASGFAVTDEPDAFSVERGVDGFLSF